MTNMINCLILELWKNECQHFRIKRMKFEELSDNSFYIALASAIGSTKHLNLKLIEFFFRILLPYFPRTMEDISQRKDFIDSSLLSNPALTIDLLLASP